MVGAIIDSMGAAQSMPFYAAIRRRKSMRLKNALNIVIPILKNKDRRQAPIPQSVSGLLKRSHYEFGDTRLNDEYSMRRSRSGRTSSIWISSSGVNRTRSFSRASGEERS